MISFLNGKFVHKTPTLVVVDINGIGYECNISLNTYGKIAEKDEGLLYTWVNFSITPVSTVLSLYGFADKEEKELFVKLVGISGISAAIARVALSGMKPAELSQAIIRGDIKTLQTIKGIGKKTAERIVVELKEKLSKSALETNISALKDNTLHSDALNALTALGIGRNAAELAVQKVIQSESSTPSLEEVIKKALKNL